MRHIAAFLAVAASLAYGGCANTPSVDLSSPAAAERAGQIVTAVVCGTGTLSRTARGVVRKRADKQAQQIVQTIYVASSALCGVLGGQVQGKQNVPAAAVTPVAK